MALAMPRPSVRPRTGVYHFNVRIPADLRDKIQATRVALPLDERQVTVVAIDKVAFSLRTKDPAVARARFTPAYAALVRHFDAVRAGPKPLTHKQLVALAGDVYRRWVEQYENDPELTPAWLAGESKRADDDVEGWRDDPSDGVGPISTQSAVWLTRLARPNGPYLTAFEIIRDIDQHGISVRLDDAHEVLFGGDADRLCAERHLILDASTRCTLMREVAQAVRFAAEKLLRNVASDYSPDPAAQRFPAYEQPRVEPPRKATTSVNVETVGALFQRWKAYATDKVASSTLRRYGPSLASLDRWAKGRDWRTLIHEDIFAWATSRRDADGIAPATVNRNDLVAVSSVLAWPMSLSGGKLIATNAAAGIKLPLPAKQSKREKTFREAEIRAILRASRAVKPDARYPRASASRRWCSWLCAYSGARIQETLWLEKRHIWKEGNVWAMHFDQTEDGNARTVPIHAELIREGFLDFVAAAPSGFLFVGDVPPKSERDTYAAGTSGSRTDVVDSF